MRSKFDPQPTVGQRLHEPIEGLVKPPTERRSRPAVPLVEEVCLPENLVVVDLSLRQHGFEDLMHFLTSRGFPLRYVPSCLVPPRPSRWCVEHATAPESSLVKARLLRNWA